MGHYRHFILSFLVIPFSLFALSDNELLDLINNKLYWIELNVGPEYAGSGRSDIYSEVDLISGRTRDIANDVSSMQSYFYDWNRHFIGIDSQTYDMSLDLEDLANDLSQFIDDYRVRYHPSISNVIVKTKNEVVAAVEKSIDTNQYYLSAILAELRKNKTPYYEASFLNDSLVHGNSLSDIYYDIWYNATNSYWQILSRDYGLWQAIALQPFFDYDMSQLEGRAVFNENLAKEKWPIFSTFRKIFGTGSSHDASPAQIDSFFSGGLGQMKMKYYGTYPTYLAISNLLSVTTNGLPSSFFSSSYFVEDDQGDVYVNTNSSYFAFADRVNSNALAGVSTSYDGPSNAVWEVGEDTEVGERFSSLFSVTNLVDSISETFGELTDNLNESPNSMIQSLKTLKGGSRVFSIDYHPNFWIQGMTEAPTQTISVNADKVLSPDVLVIIEFVKTFALFGGSLILGITTFYSVMKENPLWFN